MSSLAKAVAAFLVLPGVVAGVVPLLILGGCPAWDRAHPAGLGLLAAGVVLLLWCVVEFYASGKGTLAPWSPPARLVVVGPYRHARNPMYLAVLLVTAGWAIAFRSPPLGAYSLLLAPAFHLRVVLAEEPRLARAFGGEWERYRAQVPRWLPRLRR